MARRLTARPSPAWVGDLPVFERTLANGFKALVLPRTHAPVVVCDLYYPAGSVDEPAGKTGLAHFVEHMLFKGTERFPKGQIDRLAFVAAGQSNAETGEDCTHYWFAFPSDRWELALEVEADRMRGATFDPREVEAERHVIGEERARDLDSPMGRLDQTHLALTYLRHPYRNPILGWPDDLARIGSEDLRAFYRQHYRPDGAVLVIVGDIDPERALDRVSAHFEPLRPGVDERLPPPLTEPRQMGRRDFTLVDAESVARGLLGWHSVPRGHSDGPALNVLSDLLTCGRRSRLWNELVERRKLATWVETGQDDARWAGQFLLQVEAASDVEPARIEHAIAELIAELADEGPTPEELSRSRHRLEAAWRWEQEDLAGLAAGLGNVALWDDWRAWQAEHRAAMAVSPDDIRRVASTYLVDSSLTGGWSMPRSGRTMTVLLPSETVPEVTWTAPDPSPDRPILLEIPNGNSRLTDYSPQRTTLSNGLRLIYERRPETGIVALELFVDAGLLRETKPGLAYLTGRLLEEGTKSRPAETLAEAIEDVGGTIDVGSTGVSLRVRAEDLPLAIEILADVALHPSFPEEAFPWAKRRIAAELQGDREDPAFRADLIFRGLVYGDHPYARDPRGSSRDIARLSLPDVKAHHRNHFAADNAFLVAAGDFDPKKLTSLVKTHFDRWKPRGGSLEDYPRLVRSARPRVRRISQPGEQVHIVLGHLGIPRNHPDFDALAVLDHIFGSGPGFTDRLSRILRDELGLAYSVGGGITDTADVVPGLFRVYVGTMPDEADRVVAAIAEQVRAMHEGAFTDDEVDCARRYLAGSWVFDFQTVEQRAERLMELERWGLPLDEPIHWPERISRVSTAKVRRAARSHLDPAALIRVEFGPIRRRQRPSAECA
ncbi:M16 family metallopeptidase [Singulisphaera acidiphila]|uniref:Putative Zn-dependent peptidase n=1 Tax=Singulisphaera acidiphila (strain ATCC BAA-1392 / DSM 18658 / VKM B-2454 / MOB10) TaxID=886293 RepID=L0DAJ4_SINAD|nr:pitrilysin family protein [Singulisphaera acidiphila]AGA25696.1 putative Zn-dependent peptidase [Singulisphaera acidiphila DSM 18658]